MSILKDVGIVTAYGYAKENGYEGTEAEYGELMANFANAAAQAVAAKNDAIQAKEDAEEALSDIAHTIANHYPTDTASGSIASFPDGADGVEIKSATVQIVPKQSGTGDPSPDNVRAITGWDAVTVTGCGFNVWSEQWRAGNYRDTNGEFYVPSTTYLCNATPIPVIPGTQIYSTAVVRRFWYDENMNFLSYQANTDGAFTVPANARYFNFRAVAYANPTTYNNDISINYPATDTSYHAYDGTTYPLTLPSTVYGGTLTYEGDGVWTVTVDRCAVDLGSLTWTRRGTYAMQSNGLAALITQPAANIDPNLVCSIAKSSNWTAFVSAGPSAGLVATSGGYIAVSTDATDPAVWKASVTGQTLVYPLATPTDFSITPVTDLVSQYGQNNIWADCGDTSATYRADVQLYIDKKLAQVLNA